MNKLTLGDYCVIAVYLTTIAAVGVAEYQKNKDARDFALAGRSASWIAVGISIAAAFISGISYMGIPAEVFAHGLKFLLYALAYLLVIPVIVYLFLPFYGRLKITTAYEYLEQRFDRRVRLLGSGLFIVWRLLWIATVIYVPSLLISGVTGSPLLPSVLLLGVITTAYTTAGGLRAVIWTDATPFFVMTGGAAVAIHFAAQSVSGGLPEILSIAAKHGRTELFDFSLDPTVRLTVWGTIIGGCFANLAFFGADQMVIQRYLATKGVKDMRTTYLLNCIALLVVIGLLAMLGLSLFAFYQEKPGGYPDIGPDSVLPYFIAGEFPAGLRGVLVASILAASMSALSAGVNAVTTAIYHDFLQQEDTSPTSLRRIRQLSMGTGLFCTGLATMIGNLGSIIEIAVRVIDGFAGPLLALFLVGMLMPKVGAPAALTGVLVGLAASSAVNFLSSISFVWFPAIGCLVSVGSACAAQLFLTTRREAA